MRAISKAVAEDVAGMSAGLVAFAEPEESFKKRKKK